MKDKEKMDAALDRLFAYGPSRKSDTRSHATKEKLGDNKQRGSDNKPMQPTSSDGPISKNER